MGFRFRKSIKLAPGVKLNLGGKSMGLSVGGKYGGVSYNSRTGARSRISAPGTGLSYTSKIGKSSRPQAGRSKTFSGAAEPHILSSKGLDKRAAFFMSVLLGPLGVDRFYMGYVKDGILKLLTVGGLGIWWIADIVKLCSGSLTPAPGYYWLDADFDDSSQQGESASQTGDLEENAEPIQPPLRQK